MAADLDESSVIPESVMDSVKKTLSKVEELKNQFPDLLSLSDPETLAEMHPLQRAQSLLRLAEATTTIFTLRLRCSGVHPDDHPVKSELERLSIYQAKLVRFIDMCKAPLRPSTRLNYQAANRFIEHSLPDLTSEQKQSMRDISRGQGRKMTYLEKGVQKRRRCQSSERKSVETAAKEFLEKAAYELLGDNKDGFKGPLRPEAADEDDMHTG